jgi:hypothetical protein
MKPCSRICAALGLLLVVALVGLPVAAQWPYGMQPPSTTPDAQRNALASLRTQMNFFQNATRSASNFGDQGYGNVWQSFQEFRQSYNSFKQTLTPQQASYGANELAELDAGLDIIQEAFANYQEDVGSGQSTSMALSSMCRVLRQASGVWMRELNQTCSRLRVGFA